MAIDGLPDSELKESSSAIIPKVKVLTMSRLGLFQMGLGIMSLLTLGVINRLMIDELKVLPWIAAGAIAMHQFMSPARVWFGQMSDAKTIFGYHRTGFILDWGSTFYYHILHRPASSLAARRQFTSYRMEPTNL